MTLLEKLQSHKGGLLRIKTQLYWYDGRGWDRFPGRICLLLDVETPFEALGILAAARGSTPTSTSALPPATTLLLIDGAPRWVWVVAEDIEII